MAVERVCGLYGKKSEMEKAYNNAKAEAAASFKNDGIYMEKFVEEPRHIEIQVAGDQFGNVCHLSERDCSIQRRHQKLVEESPSPFMTDELRRKWVKQQLKPQAAINYESVGTIEFLVDKNRNFYFMEMNTRIQVEHCVTEEVINFDLIKEQMKIAMGEKIPGKIIIRRCMLLNAASMQKILIMIFVRHPENHYA